MKKNIDALDNLTGWVVNAPSTVSVNSFPELVAGLNSNSLQFKIDTQDLTRTISKTISPGIDVTEYNTLVLSIWSQNYGKSILYRKPGDYSYKISFDGVTEFYLPIYSGFQDISIGIEAISTISEITITALHPTTDFIVISEMVAELEESNYDVLFSVKENLEKEISNELGDGVLISSGFSGDSGDTLLTIPAGVPYLDRYAVIKIKEGAVEELHQIGNNTETGFSMLNFYGGSALLNDFVNAAIYLQFPVLINPTEQDAFIPGVSVWGVSPEEIFQDFKLTEEIDTLRAPGTFSGRCAMIHLEYPVLIDCEAREYELLNTISAIVRKWIGKEICWINGRKHDIAPGGPAVEIRPNESLNLIPKNQYNLVVGVTESLYNRHNVPAVSQINIQTTPERS